MPKKQIEKIDIDAVTAPYEDGVDERDVFRMLGATLVALRKKQNEIIDHINFQEEEKTFLARTDLKFGDVPGSS